MAGKGQQGRNDAENSDTAPLHLFAFDERKYCNDNCNYTGCGSQNVANPVHISSLKSIMASLA